MRSPSRAGQKDAQNVLDGGYRGASSEAVIAVTFAGDLGLPLGREIAFGKLCKSPTFGFAERRQLSRKEREKGRHSLSGNEGASGTEAFAGEGPRVDRLYLFKLPAGGFALEMLFPQTEDNAWADSKDGFLHRENVIFHRGHVEVVFASVLCQEFAASGDVGDFRGALDDHGFIRVLGAHYAVGILRQVAGFARLAAGTEA